MRGVVAIAIVAVWGGVSRVAAVDVPLPAHPISIDGDLREWGKAAWIAVEPAGEEVGLRGVFRDSDDHDAVVLVQWDAEFLYVAAAVTDDILDIGRVAPDQREWKGSGSQRKDRMFYYDHMKVFVREPGVSAGYNLWLAPPGPEDEGPYWWGGRQRQPETVNPPQVRVAGLVAGNTRTFEMAIPWTWMEAYPQPGDLFDAMFLFTDSDRPGEEVAIKIARKEDRWIWWQGRLQLTGQPDGLRPRPEPEPRRRAEPAPEVQQPLDPRIVEAIARSRETAAAAQAAHLDSAARVARASASAAPGAKASSSAVAIAATAPPAPVDAEAISSRSATGALRARLNRRLLARRTGASAPQYMRALERDPSLSDAQIDTFYAVLHRHVSRIVTQRVTMRIDFFVVDMASASACRRDQSRKYLVDLLANLSGTHDDVAADWITRAATRSGAGPTAAAFVREVALRAGKIFAQRGITTSEELIKRGRKKSGLDPDQAYALIGALLGL